MSFGVDVVFGQLSAGMFFARLFGQRVGQFISGLFGETSSEHFVENCRRTGAPGPRGYDAHAQRQRCRSVSSASSPSASAMANVPKIQDSAAAWPCLGIHRQKHRGVSFFTLLTVNTRLLRVSFGSAPSPL